MPNFTSKYIDFQYLFSVTMKHLFYHHLINIFLRRCTDFNYVNVRCMYQVFAFIVSYHFLRQGERCNSARNLECSYKYFGLIMGNEEWMPRNYTTVIKKKKTNIDRRSSQLSSWPRYEATLNSEC